MRENNHNEWTKFIKRRLRIIVLITLGVTGAVAWWSNDQDLIYEGKFNLLVEMPSNSDANTGDTAQGENGSFNQEKVMGNPQFNYQTEIQVLQSTSVLNPIFEDLIKQSPDIKTEDIQNLNIQQLKDSRILEVTYKDKDPEKIDLILDKLSKTYVDKNSTKDNGNLGERISFVENKLSDFGQKVNSLQNELQGLRKKHSLLDPQKKAAELTKKIIDTEKSSFETKIQLEQVSSNYSDIEKQLDLSEKQAIAVTYLTESPSYQILLAELQNVQIKLALESANFTDENPQIIALKEKKDNVLNLLRKESKHLLKDQFKNISDEQLIFLSSPSKIRSQLIEQLIFKGHEIKALQVKNDNLQTELKKLNSLVQQMPAVERKYSQLLTDIHNNKESLNRFLEAKDRLELEKTRSTMNLQLISPPKEPLPINDGIPFTNLVLGFLGGLGLGFLVALLEDILDPFIHSIEDLKALTSNPIVGYIPVNKNNQYFQQLFYKVFPENSKKNDSRPSWFDNTRSSKNSSPHWIESFRNLYTNLNLLNREKMTGSFVISNVHVKNQQSNISVNLAKAAAAMGQKVLLIDANLRFPEIHKDLGLSAYPGLSNLLHDNLDLNETIQKLPQWENLFILTAGNVPADPTLLFYSPNMLDLVAQLKEEQYDCIIYNAPALRGCSDAKIIAPFTDGMVMVVTMDKTQRIHFKQVQGDLNLSHIPVLGLVAENVNSHDQDYYYDSSYYDRKNINVDSELTNTTKLNNIKLTSSSDEILNTEVDELENDVNTAFREDKSLNSTTENV